ncbi:hypothetical protein NQD34_001143 [Periophthalmus magnuspinnatus]|nr:hypothetical protein NQD34_001143 [Periophthalmus magnuspinnatus]
MGPNIQLLLLLGTITAAFKYKFISTKKNWADAHSYCVTKYTDLAPINDESDIKLLQEQAAGYSGLIWFGLIRKIIDQNTYRYMWSGGGEVKRFFWGKNQPDSGKDDNYGLLINYRWHDISDKTEAFFCYSVHVVREEKTWEEALDHCRTHYTDMATISSETEMMLIQKELNKNTSTAHVWMGLRFLAKEWMWVDGQVREYEAWGQGGKPECPVGNRDCGALVFKEGVWEAHDSREKLHFICY